MAAAVAAVPLIAAAGGRRLPVSPWSDVFTT